MIRIKIKSVNYFEIHNINRYMLYVDFIFINFFFNNFFILKKFINNI